MSRNPIIEEQRLTEEVRQKEEQRLKEELKRKKEAEIEELEHKLKVLKVEREGLEMPGKMTEQDMAAMVHINRYSKYALAMGVVPVPWMDLVGVTVIQMKMVRMIALEYKVPYEESSMKGFIGSLLGAVVPIKLGYGAIGSLLKAVPLIGPVAGFLSVPAFSYASTRAVGRVFMVHFAAGGTLLNFDPGEVRGRFRTEFERARQEVPSVAKAG